MTTALLSTFDGPGDKALLLLGIMLSVALLTGIAYQWPVFTMVLFLVMGPLADVMHVTASAGFIESINVAAIRPADAVLVAMLGASCVRVGAAAFTHRRRFTAAMSWTLGLFASWVLIEIARNVPAHGLSAPGEFRYSYLVLAMPVYVTLFFVRAKERRQLLKITILVATLVTLCFVPLIGVMKGWGVGPESRFLPAVLSLGLALGWIALFLAVRTGALRISIAFVWLLALPVAVLLLADGHRSVWLVLLAVPIILILMREVQPRIPGWTVPVAVLTGLILVVVFAAGVDLVPYVTARARAFTAPSSDRDASWRESQWQGQLTVWRRDPLAGEGLGGYWSAGQEYGAADVAPHNLYVQTLVKLGGVGLALMLALALSIALLLARALARLRPLTRHNELDHTLIVMGVIGLTAVLVYGVAYALDYYALLFVGLGIAAAVHGAAPQRIAAADPAFQAATSPHSLPAGESGIPTR